MQFRVATLNMEQDHKRWQARRHLIIAQLGVVKPDVLALNEVSVPQQSARWIQKTAKEQCGLEYALVQQSRTNGLSAIEAEATLTRFPIVETSNFDFRARDMVAQVTRVLIDKSLVDVYVTHLYMSRGDDSLRLFQVQQLLAWTDSRDDAMARIICGDFNATRDQPSAQLMAQRFKCTQTAPTAFTPLAGDDGNVSHPYWPRMDRCIDYIWMSGPLQLLASGVCFNEPDAAGPALWPSDHAGVWADFSIG